MKAVHGRELTVATRAGMDWTFAVGAETLIRKDGAAFKVADPKSLERLTVGDKVAVKYYDADGKITVKEIKVK
jgi:hypothetical protein